MRLLAWGLSDVGRKRDHNEDSLLVNTDLGLFAVADGMGGHAGGARASKLAVEILEREIARLDAPALAAPASPTSETPFGRALRQAALEAGHAIFDMAESSPELSGMGTTLTALFLNGGRAYLAHVGDSRAYLYRDAAIEQLTEDHSWIEEQVRAGFMTPAEAQESSLKHIITRSVGFERDVDVDLLVMPVLMGDCFLLCSDGLSNQLPPEDLRRELGEVFYADLPSHLVVRANQRGGDDNISVVVVYVANDGGQS